MNDKPIQLIYDKECPACNNYCQMVRIREDLGPLKLVDARKDSAVMDEISSMGLDIDQGMVLKLEDRIYYGSDAIHALALISSHSGVFNRFNYWMFKSKGRSLVCYPILRFLRNGLLKMLRKTRINNLQINGNDRF